MDGRTLKAEIHSAAAKSRRAVWPLIFIFALLLSACGGGDQAKDFDAEQEGEDLNVKTGVKPEPDSEVAVLDVQDFGKLVIELYPNIAPQMVERFKTLARAGFYDGTAIHRVEPPTAGNPGGVIQGGDPNSKDDKYADDGRGQSDLPDVPAEASDLPYELGTVGAADSGPGTANCQFFISLGPNPTWERRYTVFGKVIRGLNDVKIISNAPRRPGTTNPDPKVVIRSITLEPRANYQ